MPSEPSQSENLPRMYYELADWWPLISAPEDYAEEAVFIRAALGRGVSGAFNTLLELGSGGGNNASHLKSNLKLTLVDRSVQMLSVSRGLNPDCEHLAGDMRNIRLNRQFDSVLLHDAIMYMTTLDDLRKALETAWVHCRPGGAMLVLPDAVRETFHAKTHQGGHDGLGRAMRFLSWTYDPDPTDATYITDYVYLLRNDPDRTRVLYDRHIEGLFPRATWLRTMQDVGFTPRLIVDPFERETFLGIKDAG
ncbi:MAG: class I SAM-dependent methyltransferase [Anaerolineales bacterium]